MCEVSAVTLRSRTKQLNASQIKQSIVENQKKIIMMTMAYPMSHNRQRPDASIFSQTIINLTQKDRSELRHNEADCWVA